MVKVQMKLDHVHKDSTNPFFKSKYASLTNVIDAARPVLNEFGFAVFQRVRTINKHVIVSTRLVHESGEWIEDGGVALPVSKLDAQGYGSAVTYGRRYGLATLIGLGQDDDDAHSAVGR